MSNWQAGDTAQIAADRHIPEKYKYVIGNTCKLLEFVGPFPLRTGNYLLDAWSVEISGRPWIVSEKLLRKPYDRLEPATMSWQEMKDKWNERETVNVI